MRAQEESLRTRVEELEVLADQQREKSRRQRSEAESFQEDIAEFAEAQDQLSKAQASILVLDDREKELQELQTALRDRHGEVLRRVNELLRLATVFGRKRQSNPIYEVRGLTAELVG